MRNRWCGTILLLTTFLLLSAPAWAQTSTSATLSQPDTQAFPSIRVYLDVKDELGRFIHGLDPEALRAVEDGKALPVNELRELRPGAQLVVALNPGPSFALRDSQGTSRSNFIQRTLESWAKSRRGSTLDDMSLLVTNSVETTHFSDPLKWLDALKLDQMDARQAAPSLDTLSRAIEIASDPTPRQGMGKAVLFITTPTEDQSEVAIQNLIDRAKEQGIKIYIWLVPVPGAYYPNAEKQFQEVVSQTGGQLFTYTDEQPTLNIEGFIESLRSIYGLNYDSQIRSSGSHDLAVDIQTPSGAITTPVQAFELNVQAPEPAFVSPPLGILRKAPVGEDGKVNEDASPTEYLPAQQEIQVLVGFPDERVRPLARTSLYVDGILVQENHQPPFDRFTWSLKDYTTNGTHIIRVEAEDDLGLVGASIERVVQLTVEQPTHSPWSWVFRNALALSILGALVAGSILLLVLLLGGRLRPRIPGTSKPSRRKSDPVTQPVPVKSEASAKRLSGWVNRIHWPQRNIPPTAYAFLSRITDTDSQATTTPIPLITDEITLGSDPNLATLVLNDPSIEGLHARLLHKEDGSFRLNDEGSIAGTWVNYTPISREGATLEHGDLVHIGRLGFRFTTRGSGRARKAVVTLVEPPQDHSA
jgi:hypothetical protein